ncbi:Gfo/Idh/MocA family protein [Polaribacter gochangensis]|uniref:Gfo/Idh/MocA family protein n=1 Tax=Polaribacter gochangensis TaxID=3252903 RepID=UPI003904D531
MNNNILIIGVGSIGKRHLKNLFQLGFINISLVRKSGSKVNEFPNLPVFKSIEEAYETNSFCYVFICTPTALHYNCFLEISKYTTKNIYIEKPIANNKFEAEEINKISLKNDLNVIIGFDLHFDLGLNKVKELLELELIGKVCSFQAEVGQYLPDWRPNEDYREGMSAKKSLGGGVMLDLIHEFDYINWLFGPITSIFGKHHQISDLEIETEDVSVNILQTSTGVIGTIYLDYLQKELSRTCKIVGSKGTIILDYTNAVVKWMTHDNPIWNKFEYKQIERNDRFITIIKAFMNSSLKNRDTRLTTTNEAIESITLVEKSKLSNTENKLIHV